ncbi:hypothetical protein [Psychrobacter sp.]|uniref:hypothetical protein n=1 Tax=Psychrobacter sp. TaxID=56811 RepID=UPI0025EC7F1F|nr:hypothetical protein [Psychrobacter sp.]
MFSHSLNPKIGSIDLSVEQKERLIKAIKNCKLPDYEADYPEIKKGLLERLEGHHDNNEGFKMTILEQGFMLYTASVTEDLDLYGYISYNSRF